MPQQADKLTKNQAETMKVCQLLLYVQGKIEGMMLPMWIRWNATTDNPDTSRLYHAINTLGRICKDMTQHEQARIIYNGRDAEAKRLADWWDTLQGLDRKQRIEEKRKSQIAKTRKRAVAKLTRAERNALGYE